MPIVILSKKSSIFEMNVFQRLFRSVLKKTKKGKSFLQLQDAKKALFTPCGSFFNHMEKGADSVYVPAFERLFLLYKAYLANGFRGDILEFGVLNGYTAHLFAKMMVRFQIDSARLHLFDSFEGLPENQAIDDLSYEAVNKTWFPGAMYVSQQIPDLILSKLGKILGKDRVFVKKGFFEDTLLSHLETAEVKKATIVHLDCDLYSASKFVLCTLIEKEIFQDGTMLICDDWMCSFGNPNFGQKRALSEVEKEYPWSFEKYLNYGIGSQIFIAHDKRVQRGKNLHELYESLTQAIK